MHKIVSTSKRFSPSQDNPIIRLPTQFVLIEERDGKFIGLVGHGTPEWVAEWGDPLSYEEALIHFLGLKKESYRD